MIVKASKKRKSKNSKSKSKVKVQEELKRKLKLDNNFVQANKSKTANQHRISRKRKQFA
jgi:hypothetical protein